LIKKSKALLCTAVFLVSSLCTRGTILFGPVTNQANGHTYYLLQTNTWAVSENEATALGGHLATIRSQAEHDFIYTNFSGFGGVARHLWIGLRRSTANPSTFEWVSGEPIVYTHWASGEPNNCDGIENRGMIFSPTYPIPGFWNDINDSGSGGCGGGFLNPNAVAEIITDPPRILSQPTNRTVFVGDETTFAVSSTGSVPLQYQWSKDGIPIPTATQAALVLTNIQLSQTGAYFVVVSNQYGTTNSATATLTVLAVPPCTAPPTGLVSWWAGDGNALDQNRLNNGSIVDGVGFVAGRVRQAFTFNGNGSVVRLGASDSLKLQNFTIETWLRRLSNKI
jgi:hypothetical protein